MLHKIDVRYDRNRNGIGSTEKIHFEVTENGKVIFKEEKTYELNMMFDPRDRAYELRDLVERQCNLYLLEYREKDYKREREEVIFSLLAQIKAPPDLFMDDFDYQFKLALNYVVSKIIQKLNPEVKP
jgi:hypothetical protein